MPLGVPHLLGVAGTIHHGIRRASAGQQCINSAQMAYNTAGLVLRPTGLLLSCTTLSTQAADEWGSAEWHPGVDDPSAATAALDDMRLEVLHQKLGVAGSVDPSKELGYYIKILRAFRTGELGRYMLDDLA